MVWPKGPRTRRAVPPMYVRIDIRIVIRVLYVVLFVSDEHHKVIANRSDLTDGLDGHFSSVNQVVNQLSQMADTDRKIFVVMGNNETYNFVSGAFGWLGHQQWKKKGCK